MDEGRKMCDVLWMMDDGELREEGREMRNEGNNLHLNSYLIIKDSALSIIIVLSLLSFRERHQQKNPNDFHR